MTNKVKTKIGIREESIGEIRSVLEKSPTYPLRPHYPRYVDISTVEIGVGEFWMG